MQSLLNDIELDVQELKCVLQALSSDAGGTLRAVARRNIAQLRHRLDALASLLEEDTPCPPHAGVPCEESRSVCIPQDDGGSNQDTDTAAAPAQSAVQSVQPQSVILGERIRPGVDMSHALSLNDSFRFARELFGGDMAGLNGLLRNLSGMSSFDEAVELVLASVHVDGEEREAVLADFVEVLKKYFT